MVFLSERIGCTTLLRHLYDDQEQPCRLLPLLDPCGPLLGQLCRAVQRSPPPDSISIACGIDPGASARAELPASVAERPVR